MVGSGNLFAVKVTGDSMVGANNFQGDCVVACQQNNAVNGDIVAHGSATGPRSRRSGA